MFASEEKIPKLYKQIAKVLIYYLHSVTISIFPKAFKHIFGHDLTFSNTSSHDSEKFTAAFNKLTIFYHAKIVFITLYLHRNIIFNY
jgi:hypothetical protein